MAEYLLDDRPIFNADDHFDSATTFATRLDASREYHLFIIRFSLSPAQKCMSDFRRFAAIQ